MIGIFDSGIGGLTVASAIRAQAPQADLVYFADLAHMPFGAKSEEELLEITRNAIRFLREHGATEIVAACNSVSLLVSGLRSEIDVPLIEMSEPTVGKIADPSLPPLGRGGERARIMIVATEATVRSRMYEEAFLKKGIETVSVAIPELASAIERDASADELRRIIQPAVDHAITSKIKTLVLGCTQFPFARSVFVSAFLEKEYQIELFDPANAVAIEVVSKFDVNGTGLQMFYTSKSSDVFDRQVKNIFDTVIV